MVKLDDLNNWKRCKRKKSVFYICKPEINTVVIDRIKHAETLNKVGKVIVTPEEIKKNSNLLSYLKNCISSHSAYLIDNVHPYLVCNSIGSFSVMTSKQICELFAVEHNSELRPISFKYLLSLEINGCFDWIKVESLTDTLDEMAIFVPKEQSGVLGIVDYYNEPSISHGLGDFIICSSNNDYPLFNTARVVNGLCFQVEYNIKNWSNCVDTNLKIKEVQLKNLPKLKLSKKSVKNRNDSNIFDINLIDIKKIKKVLKVKTVSKITDCRLRVDDVTIDIDSTSKTLSVHNDNISVKSNDLTSGIIDLYVKYSKYKFDKRSKIDKDLIEKFTKIHNSIFNNNDTCKDFDIIESKDKGYLAYYILFDKSDISYGINCERIKDGVYIVTYVKSINSENLDDMLEIDLTDRGISFSYVDLVPDIAIEEIVKFAYNNFN